MIIITNLAKLHGKRVLFEKFNLTITGGERIGLIGPNGAGKTTFFNIILRREEPSAGTVQINKGVRIGYLPQEADFSSSRSVLAEVVEGDEVTMRLCQEKVALEEENKTTTSRYGHILQELEFLGFFDLEPRAKKVLMGLGFKESDLLRPICELSGGWQMRALLAKLLVCHYDILLLDEPTNFLDLNATLWFKDYLAAFKGTFIVISHDRDFLDEVTNYTLVLENATFTKVKGNYEHYEKMKHEKRLHLLKQFQEQQRRRQQLQRFIDRFHAQPNKAAQVRAKRRMLERMKEIIVPEDRRQSIKTFRFPQCPRGGYYTVKLRNVCKFYGAINVYRDFDFDLIRGEKAVMVGPNGAGKSTLLKILAGVVDIDSGMRVLGHNVTVGYFSQTRMEVLNPERTVLEEASLVASPEMPGDQIRTMLSIFLFCGDDVFKKVKVLSGGEKSRLILAKLLINPPNLLLLDEPTTHLDVDAVDALIKALTEYAGTLVFISHDLHFVRTVANTVFEVNAGQVRKFPGDFDYYQRKRKDMRPLEEARSEQGASCRLQDKEGQKEESLRHKQRALQEKARRQMRKTHNKRIAREIKKRQKERGELEVELYAKRRIVAKPRSIHSREIIAEYRQRIEKIERRLSEIEKEIRRLKGSFIL